MSNTELTLVSITRLAGADRPALVKIRHRDGSLTQTEVEPGEHLLVRLDRLEEVTVADI